MSEYTLAPYSLRRLLPIEWPLLKAIRLEALTTNPSVYGSSVAIESGFTDAHWQDRLKARHNAVWGLFHEEKIIGLTSIFGNTEEPSEARLTTSFIQPLHRGKGLSALFYKARIDWARGTGLKRLVVTHRIGNDASRAANQRAGFRYTHSENRLWPDGQEAEHLFYVLDL